MRQFLDLFTRVDGRIGRGRFWLGVFIAILVGLAVSLLLVAMGFGETTRISGTIVLDSGEANAFERVRYTLAPWLALPVSLVVLAMFTVVALKRRKDRDSPGWEVLAFGGLVLLRHLVSAIGVTGALIDTLNVVIFVLGVILFVYLGLLKGTYGPNRFGEDPLAPTALRKVT